MFVDLHGSDDLFVINGVHWPSGCWVNWLFHLLFNTFLGAVWCQDDLSVHDSSGNRENGPSHHTSDDNPAWIFLLLDCGLSRNRHFVAWFFYCLGGAVFVHDCLANDSHFGGLDEFLDRIFDRLGTLIGCTFDRLNHTSDNSPLDVLDGSSAHDSSDLVFLLFLFDFRLWFNSQRALQWTHVLWFLDNRLLSGGRLDSATQYGSLALFWLFHGDGRLIDALFDVSFFASWKHFASSDDSDFVGQHHWSTDNLFDYHTFVVLYVFHRLWFFFFRSDLHRVDSFRFVQHFLFAVWLPENPRLEDFLNRLDFVSSLLGRSRHVNAMDRSAGDVDVINLWFVLCRFFFHGLLLFDFLSGAVWQNDDLSNDSFSYGDCLSYNCTIFVKGNSFFWFFFLGLVVLWAVRWQESCSVNNPLGSCFGTGFLRLLRKVDESVRYVFLFVDLHRSNHLFVANTWPLFFSP